MFKRWPKLLESGWRWLPLSLVMIVLDQWSKLAVVQRFALHEWVPVLPILDFGRWHNPGAAFSFLAGAGGWQRWFFTAIALGASVAIVIWLRSTRAFAQRLMTIGGAMILSGAVGNVIDRLRWGYVVDFIHVNWTGFSFPAFNVADICINIGAGCWLLDMVLDWSRSRRRTGFT